MLRSNTGRELRKAGGLTKSQAHSLFFISSAVPKMHLLGVSICKEKRVLRKPLAILFSHLIIQKYNDSFYGSITLFPVYFNTPTYPECRCYEKNELNATLLSLSCFIMKRQCLPLMTNLTFKLTRATESIDLYLTSTSSLSYPLYVKIKSIKFFHSVRVPKS